MCLICLRGVFYFLNLVSTLLSSSQVQKKNAALFCSPGVTFPTRVSFGEKKGREGEGKRVEVL